MEAERGTQSLSSAGADAVVSAPSLFRKSIIFSPAGIGSCFFACPDGLVFRESFHMRAD